jgi:hypothetical protein
MLSRRLLGTICILLAASATTAWAEAVVPVDLNVMTSGFFQGTNVVRGYAGEGRTVERVSTPGAFGVAGAETVYLTFDFDFASLGEPVPQATLRVESVPGGFGADAAPGSPFLMSAHGLTADPIASITDDTNPSGPIHWVDFYDNNILPADPAAMTVVEGHGTLEFDITGLVNSWINGTNTVFALALTGKNDTSGGEFLHGILNDAETPGASHSISIVPEPASCTLLVLGLAGTVALVIRRRRASR